MRATLIAEARCLCQNFQLTPARGFRGPVLQWAQQHRRRQLHRSARALVVKPYLLADIGEGITECQIIQWFVQPGARVEQFDKICEVQSDKATVEITSRFDGIIKKLYYEPDDMAKVGKPLVDIDIQNDISPGDEELTRVSTDKAEARVIDAQKEVTKEQEDPEKRETALAKEEMQAEGGLTPTPIPGKHASLATPAVRHLIKQHDLNIVDIRGTGKDGRVLKEDVLNHVARKDVSSASPKTSQLPEFSAEDKTFQLSPVQKSMFKAMTLSLSIPRFLYTDTVDFSSLTALRKRLHGHSGAHQLPPTTVSEQRLRLSSLPFILKAVSLAFQQYPLLNSHLDTVSGQDKPQLIQKASHDFGIAVDCPAGLVVPVIRNVQQHTILSLASEIARLSSLAKDNKLTSADLSGATFTVSNIGSIGGTVVNPVIVPPQTAILGVGRARKVPAFGENGELVSREEAVFSWSADHRVIDGAYTARCAEMVRTLLEGAEGMLVRMR